MNPKYRERKLSCEKLNIIGGKNLPWSPGKGGMGLEVGWRILTPFYSQRNLWGNVK